MTITKIDEITIYEHSDGTKDIYCRFDGEMVKFERGMIGGEYNRWLTWKDILDASEQHEDLRYFIEQAEFIYSLKS